MKESNVLELKEEIQKLRAENKDLIKKNSALRIELNRLKKFIDNIEDESFNV